MCALITWRVSQRLHHFVVLGLMWLGEPENEWEKICWSFHGHRQAWKKPSCRSRCFLNKKWSILWGITEDSLIRQLTELGEREAWSWIGLTLWTGSTENLTCLKGSHCGPASSPWGGGCGPKQNASAQVRILLERMLVRISWVTSNRKLKWVTSQQRWIRSGLKFWQ